MDPSRSKEVVRILRLPLLLTFIFSDIAADNFIFHHFDEQPQLQEIILFMSFLIFQIFASPIQAGFSDFHCRKKSVIFSLFFSAVSLVIIWLTNINIFVSAAALILIVITKGGLGNTTPISWAGIADTQTKNFRFSLGLSTGAFAFGYFILIFTNTIFGGSHSILFFIVWFAIIIYICQKFFYDYRDKSTIQTDLHHLPHGHKKPGYLALAAGEFKMIIKELRHTRTRKALVTFLLWEISLYSIHMLDVDLHLPEFKNLTTSMVFGYLFGVVFLKLCEKVPDSKMIKLGYRTCIFAVLPTFFLIPFIENPRILLLVCYFFYNLGTAFLAPSLFAILSKERKAHEQGKLYGLIDSADTLAFLFAAIVGLSYKFMHLSPIIIVSFSFIIFLVSWLPYGKFEKLTPET